MKDREIKSKFRTTKAWKEFRRRVSDKQNGLCYISGKRLPKGWHLHHCDMTAENYDKLIEDNFVCLGKQMHEVVHTLFRYYQKDKTILDRLKQVLDRMCELN